MTHCAGYIRLIKILDPLDRARFIIALQCKMSKTEVKLSDNRDFAAGCCVGCGIATAITYIIGMCLCWVYARAIFPESGLALAAASIVTLPVFTIIGSLICGSVFKSCKEVEKCGDGLSMAAVSLSAIFDLIGVALLIVSMVQAANDLESPAGTIVGGSFAAFFVLLSAICNCSTICSMKGMTKENN